MSQKPKNQDQQLRFKYIFAKDYNPVFANGVYGGYTLKGEFNLNFFHERPPVPYSITHVLSKDGSLGEELSRDPDESMYIRFVTTGLVLNYGDAKNIHAWLGEKIKEFEKTAGLEPILKQQGGQD